jgi:peroxiredoxin
MGRLVLRMLICASMVLPMTGCQSHPRIHELQDIIGTQAPDFQLRDIQADGNAQPLVLSQLCHNGPVVIIFHRGLHCPICVVHLQEFSSRISEFKAAGIQVLAIGPDTLDEGRENVQAVGAFPFPLLSDPQDATARAFGLQVPAGYCQDGAFVIDPQRRMVVAQKSLEPVGDPAELLAAGKAGAASR